MTIQIEDYTKYKTLPNTADDMQLVCVSKDFEIAAVLTKTVANIIAESAYTFNLKNVKIHKLPDYHIIDADNIANASMAAVNDIYGIIGIIDGEIYFSVFSESNIIFSANELKTNAKISWSSGYNKVLSVPVYNKKDKYIFVKPIITYPTKRVKSNYAETIRSQTTSLTVNEELSGTSAKNNYIYRDFSITAKAHPLTGDIATVSGISAVNQALKTILLSTKYERPYNSYNVAANIYSNLFEVNDALTRKKIQSEISLAISNHEPRISLISIDIADNPEKYELEIHIKYIINMSGQEGSLALTLNRV